MFSIYVFLYVWCDTGVTGVCGKRAYEPNSVMGDILLPLEKTLRADRDERLQGDVDMTVDDMLRLLGEGGGLERLSGDACAIAMLLALLPLPTGATLRRLTLMLLSKLLDLE